MTVIVLKRVTPGLRGRLTKWMLEVHPGVFVGTLSPRVRDGLWELVVSAKRLGACTMVARAPSEQGFILSCSGESSRTVADFDGLQLIRRSDGPKKKRTDRSLKTE